MRHRIAQLTLVATALGALPSAASAHHVADGRLPASILEGLLSGLAHPVLGVDHLAFVVALSIAAALLHGGGRVLAAFAATAAAGAAVHLASLTLPLAEVLVAVSLVIAGLSIFAAKIDHVRMWTLLAGAAGLVHGYALTESIVGATAPVTAAYFIGVSVSVALLIVGVMAATRRLSSTDGSGVLPRRAAGAAVAALGVVFVTSALVSA